MPVETIADATENMVRASHLQQSTLTSLKGQFDKGTQALGTPGFHGPQTSKHWSAWKGNSVVRGSVHRTFDHLHFDTHKVGFQGKYKIASGVFAVEEGIFSVYLITRRSALPLSP